MDYKDFYVKCDLEIKADEDQEGVFEGYASTFGNVDVTGDVIERGAFANSLKMREPKILWQHDMQKPVGKLMSAYEDEKGLRVKGKIATQTSLGKDAYEYMKAGIIDKLSIGFRVKRDEYDHEKGNRIIKEVELFEFSLVTIPANDKADIMSVKAAPKTEREFEKFLRDCGYDRTAAKTITSVGFKGYQSDLRDAGIDTPDDDLRDADEVIKTLSNILQTLKGDSDVRRTENREGVGE